MYYHFCQCLYSKKKVIQNSLILDRFYKYVVRISVLFTEKWECTTCQIKQLDSEFQNSKCFLQLINPLFQEFLRTRTPINL